MDQAGRCLRQGYTRSGDDFWHPLEAELTTQQAADFLNVSRPFLVGLLEKNEIAYRKVGAHRRVRYADLLDFEKRSRISREDALDEIAREAERLGLD